jgi:hypothetical protein
MSAAAPANRVRTRAIRRSSESKRFAVVADDPDGSDRANSAVERHQQNFANRRINLRRCRVAAGRLHHEQGLVTADDLAARADRAWKRAVFILGECACGGHPSKDLLPINLVLQADAGRVSGCQAQERVGKAVGDGLRVRRKRLRKLRPRLRLGLVVRGSRRSSAEEVRAENLRRLDSFARGMETSDHARPS